MQNSSDNEAATATTTSSSPAAAETATSSTASSAASSTLVHATMKPARSGKCLVTFSTYEDRQEALKRTTMMDDPTTYRAKGTRPPSKIETAEKIKEKTQQETSNNNNSSSNNINNSNNNNNNISHIPKPPPMQLSPPSTNNNLKTQQFSQKSQAFNSAKSSSSSLYSNDLTSSGVTLRSSMSSANDGMGQNSELYRNSNRNTTTVPLPINQNRQTLRLGTVTIGEYQQPGARKEPEKFDFIGSTTKRQESAATSSSPTYQHETLQSELHSTLSRSKLKKTNGSVLEHQRNCPLHQSQQQQQHHQQQHNNHHHHHQHQHSSHHHQQQQPQYEYQNVNFNNTFSVSEMTNKLQKTSINGGGGGSSNHSPTTTAGGILKNGNRNSSSSGSSNKSTEKSIKFG